ncbi:hypothetical protein [Amycolatopsis kentuckyensis]|uniref:hypothetical protein n=1 Tax=Amycolatopsis kentuckyensis TaxID=218823 RepID=UPI000A375015|nr:hypothetical protein [Amycolatopsis kentuckyensis]
MREFQRALTAVFEAAPPAVLDLRIDRLDGPSRSGPVRPRVAAVRAEPVLACVMTFRAEPVRLCLAERAGVNMCLAVAAG